MSDHQEGASPDAAEGGCGSSEHAETAGQAGQQGPRQNPGADPGAAGTMNAYDIPRYNTEGYVLGRPETANDPMSAGTVQGAPAGGYQSPAQPTGAQPDPQTMASGSAAMGPPGMQPPPQGMVYAGVDPATGQPVMYTSAAMAQPGMQPPPQGMVYAGVDPVSGQPVMYTSAAMAQPGMQPPPQGMPYAGVNPAYGPQAATGVYTGQSGIQPPPRGMPYGGVDPAAGQAMPGAQQAPPTDETAAPGMDANQYGRIAEVVQDIANGEQPDVSKLAALYSSFDAQFWKGALIGAVLTVLLTNDTVKNAVAGTLGGIMGAFKKDDGHTDGESPPESD
jgi:hypothetical protein